MDGLMHVPGLATDESFVGLHFAGELAPKVPVLHGQPNPMEHEPSSFLSDFHVAGNLIAADAVLAIGDEPSCNQPFIKSDSRVFHHGSNLDREFPLRVMAGAGPSPAIRAIADLFISASRALHDSVWPALRHKMRDAIVGIREVNDCILKAFWFVAHIVPHCPNCIKKQWWSQVNYYRNFRQWGRGSGVRGQGSGKERVGGKAGGSI